MSRRERNDRSNRGAIFIGYRRQDSQGFAGRLADDLSDVLGDKQIFRDDEIPEGQDFTEVLLKALGSSSVLLAVIGPGWLTARDSSGQIRLHKSDDWVRLEIEEAFARNVWVIPVLVGGASLPAASELPPGMAKLSRVQAFVTSDRCWDQDIARLVEIIRAQVPGLRLKTSPGGSHPSSRPSGFPSILRELGEQAGQLARTRPYRPGRWRLGAYGIALVKRAATFGVALLLAYFVLERYASAEVRTFVYEFLDFSWEFIRTLLDRLTPAWLSTAS
jgi:hypothetical protein